MSIFSVTLLVVIANGNKMPNGTIASAPQSRSGNVSGGGDAYSYKTKHVGGSRSGSTSSSSSKVSKKRVTKDDKTKNGNEREGEDRRTKRAPHLPHHPEKRLLQQPRGVTVTVGGTNGNLNNNGNGNITVIRDEKILAPASDTLPTAVVAVNDNDDDDDDDGGNQDSHSGVGVTGGGAVFVVGDSGLLSPGSVASSSVQTESVTSSARTFSSEVTVGESGPYHRRRMREPSSFR